MKYIDLQEMCNDLSDFYDDEKQEKFHDIFDSLSFKLNKNVYHYNNIVRIVSDSKGLEQDNFYQSVHIPIYYEIESLLVSLRSSVDMILHLVNFTFDLALEGNNVTLGNVFRHKSLPKPLKNIFQRYTRPYDNPTWTFIYSSRNEIVHEKSVNQVLPISIDMFTSDEMLVFFQWEGHEKEMMTFFNQCLRFLETFSSQTFQAIKISL